MADPAIFLEKGRLRARLACGGADLAAAEELRLRCFQSRAAALDRFDEAASHLLIEDLHGALLCCFRVLLLPSGAEMARSYSAQFYDLSALQAYAAPVAEIGRFCIGPGQRDADILRLAWGALTRLVDRAGAGLLFGCTSFPGTSPAVYADAFAWLRQRHLAPAHLAPREKAAELHRFAAVEGAPDAAVALRRLPPLLRSYLAMGGWVSDHAVVDRAMNTLHVFTGLEVAAIPAARKRLLRAMAG
ncbi:GNAT family N-acetyltransferase [Cribrihabitans neustonicus]|uniref:GNAT family N-acetyltransferase n=1 Tax=Cribrihabitans neustonicus TaxID=1429085 RepID=UPI003B5914ED